MIKNHPHLKSTFCEPPLLSFRRNKNLKDILVHSSLQSCTQYNKTVPCNHQSCLPCQSMSNTDTVKNPELDYPSKQKEETVVHQILSMLQSVPSINSYALDFQRVSFTFFLITIYLKSIRKRSLVNFSNISTTMIVILVKI